MVTGDFFHNGGQIHALCQVEDTDDQQLGLQIITEVGQVPLKGIQSEMNGQLTLSDTLVPFVVVQSAFPLFTIALDFENARKADRQTFRLSPDFSVRYRPKGIRDGWLEGAGIDLSQEGLSLCVPTRAACRVDQRCEVELTIPPVSPRSRKKPTCLTLEGTVRWIKPVDELSEGTAIGICLTDSKQREDLIELVFQLQHHMARRPEDYLVARSA